MTKVHVLLAHPNLAKSKANRALREAIRDLPGVTVEELYALHAARGGFRLEEERAAVAPAGSLVFQFPLYWASAPSLLKLWQDEMMAPLMEEGALRGKHLLVVTTTASEQEAYRSGGRNRFTMDELLRPYQLSANHAAMVWQTPLVVHGLATPAAEANLAAGVAAYPRLLQSYLAG